MWCFRKLFLLDSVVLWMGLCSNSAETRGICFPGLSSKKEKQQHIMEVCFLA